VRLAPTEPSRRPKLAGLGEAEGALGRAKMKASRRLATTVHRAESDPLKDSSPRLALQDCRKFHEGRLS
jgi:hypothetical protein